MIETKHIDYKGDVASCSEGYTRRISKLLDRYEKELGELEEYEKLDNSQRDALTGILLNLDVGLENISRFTPNEVFGKANNIKNRTKRLLEASKKWWDMLKDIWED